VQTTSTHEASLENNGQTSIVKRDDMLLAGSGGQIASRTKEDMNLA
jgi:hypothetical protein